VPNDAVVIGALGALAAVAGERAVFSRTSSDGVLCTGCIGTASLLVATLVTGGVSIEYRSIVLLPWIFVVYASGIAVVLRYPDLLWG
jgi:hypothetical protein